MAKEPELLITMDALAKILGVTKQAIFGRYRRGTLPPPDFVTARRRTPLWRRETLVRAGVIQSEDS